MSLSPGQGVPARAWLPLLILVTLGLLWGGVTNVARYIGLSETPPLGYAFWTVLIGAALLTMANIIRRQRVPVSGQHLWYFLIAGTLTSSHMYIHTHVYVCMHVNACMYACMYIHACVRV